MRIKLQHLARGKLVHVHPEGAGQRGLAQDLLAPLFCQGNGDRTALPQAGRKPRLGLQLGVEVG